MTLPDTTALAASVENLTLMRHFFLICRDRLPISQTPSTILVNGSPEQTGRISETSSTILAGLSRDKEAVRALATEGQVVEKPSDLLKEPLVLEFLGMDERPSYSESDLESGIIDKLEHFVLELGKGFLFEGRQRRFTSDDEHYFIAPEQRRFTPKAAGMDGRNAMNPSRSTPLIDSSGIRAGSAP